MQHALIFLVARAQAAAKSPSAPPMVEISKNHSGQDIYSGKCFQNTLQAMRLGTLLIVRPVLRNIQNHTICCHLHYWLAVISCVIWSPNFPRYQNRKTMICGWTRELLYSTWHRIIMCQFIFGLLCLTLQMIALDCGLTVSIRFQRALALPVCVGLGSSARALSTSRFIAWTWMEVQNRWRDEAQQW